MPDPDKDLGMVPEVGINIVETKVQIEDCGLGLFQEITESRPRSESRSRTSSHASTKRDVLDVVNMIILQENAPMH